MASKLLGAIAIVLLAAVAASCTTVVVIDTALDAKVPKPSINKKPQRENEDGNGRQADP